MQIHSKVIKFILLYERKSPKYLRIIPFILRKLVLEVLYSCEIHPLSFNDVYAIKTFDIPHPYGIIIHPKCTIGHNVKIYQFVTIGAIDGNDYEGANVGDNVIIGAKASVLGNITLNEFSRVGAHAVVLKNCNQFDKVIGIFK